jgi:hypothetical protein
MGILLFKLLIENIKSLIALYKAKGKGKKKKNKI